MKTLTITYQQIKFLLILSNLSQTEIARKLHVSDAAVSQVITGSRMSPRIREGIAKILGKRVEQLWPPTERTSHNGLRVNKHSTKINTKKQERRSSP